MKRIIRILIIILGICIYSPVYAKSSIDYKLTIGNDYSFNEEINYVITDYEPVENGLNDALLLLEYDVPVFLTGKTNYNKDVKFENNQYYVSLSYKYNKNEINNARFINSCFYKTDFKIDSNVINYSGSGDYICNMFEDLTITVKSDIKFTSNNADEVNGNEYVWHPKNNKFNIELKYDKISNGEESSEKTDNTLAYIIIFAIIVVIIIFSLVTYSKYKKNS